MVNGMTVRASSVRAKHDNNKRAGATRFWPGAAILLATAAAALAFDAYSGGIGIFTPGDQVAESGAGRVIRVAPGGSIQAALNRAVSGDVIELQAGAVYKGGL